MYLCVKGVLNNKHEQKNNYSASKKPPKPLSLQNLNNQTGVEFFFTDLECKYIKMFVTAAGHLTTKCL